jgi:L-cystine uptake protein TcyP (sodium:dicarboxylate symporter family)
LLAVEAVALLAASEVLAVVGLLQTVPLGQVLLHLLQLHQEHFEEVVMVVAVQDLVLEEVVLVVAVVDYTVVPLLALVVEGEEDFTIVYS